MSKKCDTVLSWHQNNISCVKQCCYCCLFLASLSVQTKTSKPRWSAPWRAQIIFLVSPHHRHSYWMNQTSLGNSSGCFHASFLPSWSTGNLYVARLGTDWSLMNAARHCLIWVTVSAFCSNSTLSALSEWAISISPRLTFHYSCQCSNWITSHLKEHSSLSYPLSSLMLMSQQGRFRKNCGNSCDSWPPLHCRLGVWPLYWYYSNVLVKGLF